jgi:ATP-dependent exoDNAse (exonuclease V) alpha subunit
LIDETTLQKEYLKRVFAKVNEENLELTDYDSFKQRFQENLQELQREGYLHRNTLTLGATTIEQGYFYTEEQKQIEVGNVQIAEELANKRFDIQISDKEISREIEKFQQEKGFTLAKEQSEAVYKILDSNSSVLVIEGDAGAGKTTSMEVVKNIADKKDINVIGLAPTGKAGEELSKTLGRGETIDSFMLKIKTGQVDEKEFQNSLIIVDEAGMVSAKKSNELLKFAERTNSKIVLVGDTKQFQSIEAGAVLRDLKSADIPYHRLSEIRRQKDADYLMITKSLSAKDFETAYSKLLEKDMIRDFDSEEQAISQLTGKFDKNTLIVTNDNKTKDLLNEKIRAKLGMKDEITIKSEIPKSIQKKDLINVDKYEKGDIINLRSNRQAVVIDTNREKNTVLVEIANKNGEKEFKEYKASELQKQVRNIIQQKERGLATGDRIITLKNSKEFNVKNGELFEVREIDKQNNRIRIANDKKDIWLDLNRYKNIDHAYAITTYKSQGMTVDKVKFYAKDKTNYNEFYVAITRGKQSAEIYTTNAVQTLYTAQKTSEKDSILSRADNSKALSRDEIAKKYYEHLKQRGKPEEFKKYINYIDNIELKKQVRQEIQSLEKQKQQQQEKQQKRQLDNDFKFKSIKEIRDPEPKPQQKQKKEQKQKQEKKQEKKFKGIADYYKQAKEKEKLKQRLQQEQQRQQVERERNRDKGFGLEL